MPFTQNDLQQAIGAVLIEFWGTQKKLEETQAELAECRAKLEESTKAKELTE